MRKVAVFFGGKSCESEISVLTGVMVLNLLEAMQTMIPLKRYFIIVLIYMKMAY